jgi:hypothetical protein
MRKSRPPTLTRHDPGADELGAGAVRDNAARLGQVRQRQEVAAERRGAEAPSEDTSASPKGNRPGVGDVVSGNKLSSFA